MHRLGHATFALLFFYLGGIHIALEAFLDFWHRLSTRATIALRVFSAAISFVLTNAFVAMQVWRIAWSDSPELKLVAAVVEIAAFAAMLGFFATCASALFALFAFAFACWQGEAGKASQGSGANG